VPPHSEKIDSGQRKVTGQTPRRLIVEGWRFVAHSYAIVNQWQLLSLSRRSDVTASVLDVPLHGRRWQTKAGLFEPKEEEVLKLMRSAAPDEDAEVTLRIFFPFDFSRSRSRQTAVFGTLENQVIRLEQLANPQLYDRLRASSAPADVRVVTPSNWSAMGFYRAGFSTDQVLIVPHGVDTGTFHPMPDSRDEVRSRLAFSQDNFIFLSVGAMTGNKGIDLLLQAFARVSRMYPEARLVLKGVDELYRSADFLRSNMQTVSAEDRQRVIDRTTYFGNSLTNAEMAQLYQVADTYVSSYRAEGFNMPVLEAAGSGIPIICTRGGSTDDFVTDAFARKIESQNVSVTLEGQHIFRLAPNLEHLIDLMKSAIEDRSWREAACVAGPSHVAANYTWDKIVDLLIRGLFD
jgi:glycosyltransferase involved in cell wall biosynthesis